MTNLQLEAAGPQVLSADGLDTPRDFIPAMPACVQRLPWLSRTAKDAYSVLRRRHAAARKRGKGSFRVTMAWIGRQIACSPRTARRPSLQ